jgi:hypothetical protein
MIILKLNNRDYLFVPVPEEAYDISLGFSVMCWGIAGKADFVQLPFTEKIYVLITTTDTITEEQASELGITSNTLAYMGITGRYAIIEKI